MLPSQQARFKHPGIAGVAQNQFELWKVASHGIKMSRMPKIAYTTGCPVGRCVDAKRDIELHTFLEEGIVVVIVCGQTNHEWAQAQSTEASLLHPIFQLADSSVSSHDVDAGEGYKPFRMALKKSGDAFVPDKRRARGCVLVEAGDDCLPDSGCVEIRDKFRIFSRLSQRVTSVGF